MKQESNAQSTKLFNHRGRLPPTIPFAIMAQSFEQLQQEITDRAKAEIKQARHDYDQGMNDCKNGIYDKWFRYHRKDDGRAYDLGWVFQNQTTQNETVKFIRG